MTLSPRVRRPLTAVFVTLAPRPVTRVLARSVLAPRLRTRLTPRNKCVNSLLVLMMMIGSVFESGISVLWHGVAPLP